MARKKRIVYTSRPWEATGICSGCRLCELYCSLHQVQAFNPKRARIRVVELATGVDIPVTCQQCRDPACAAACSFEALEYDENLKIVRVNETLCTSCQACVGACPFGIITLDPISRKAIKCDLCGGDGPVCVSICPSGVLAAIDDLSMGAHSRRRFASSLAVDDELRRFRPAGEEPTLKEQKRE